MNVDLLKLKCFLWVILSFICILEINLDLVIAYKENFQTRKSKLDNQTCDEVYPLGTWGYHYLYVCIIYVWTLPSTNIFTMNIIPKDGAGFNGNVVV